MDITIIQGFGQKICGECGVVFWIPMQLEREHLNTGQGWWCPNGHRRSYKESEVDRLRNRLAEKVRELALAKSENLELKVGFDNREAELVRLRKKVKGVKKGKGA